MARWTDCRPRRRRTVERWKPQPCARRWRCRWSSADGSSADWCVSRWPLTGSGDQERPRPPAAGCRRLRQRPGEKANRRRAARERGDEVGHPDGLAQRGGCARSARRGRRRQPAVAAGWRRSQPRHSGRSDCRAPMRRTVAPSNGPGCRRRASSHRGRGGSAGRTEPRRHRRVPRAADRARSLVQRDGRAAWRTPRAAPS